MGRLWECCGFIFLVHCMCLCLLCSWVRPCWCFLAELCTCLLIACMRMAVQNRRYVGAGVGW